MGPVPYPSHFPFAVGKVASMAFRWNRAFKRWDVWSMAFGWAPSPTMRGYGWNDGRKHLRLLYNPKKHMNVPIVRWQDTWAEPVVEGLDLSGL